MNTLLVVLVFAGIALLLANEVVAARQTKMIEYRYLPRDLDTYLREEPYASATFESMFNDENLPFPRAQLRPNSRPNSGPTTVAPAQLGPSAPPSPMAMLTQAPTQPPTGFDATSATGVGNFSPIANQTLLAT